jgi:hypothetical protein
MGLLDQETQVRNSDLYDDTVAAGAGMESPAAANQNVRFDLNSLRSQIRRVNDPIGVDASTDDWFDPPLDNFGLRQVHDKKFAFKDPITPGTNDFSVGLPEIHSVDTVADVADALDGTFWTLYERADTAYYVWYSTSGGGAPDPAPAAPLGVVTWTGIQVSVTTGDTANAVATATVAAINGSAYQGTVPAPGGAGDELTLSNAIPGDVTDVADGAAATGFTFATDQQGTNTTAQGALISATQITGGAGIIAVGPTSSAEGGYIAADEASFTVAGTLGAGVSQAVDGDGIVLNLVEIIDHTTNEPVEVNQSPVFGLLQTVSGTSDGTAIAGGGSENLQISFVVIDKLTDVVALTNLVAGLYHFGATRQRCFYTLSRGSLISGSQAVPDVIKEGSQAVRLPFRHIDVTAGPAAANDPLNIQTGVFTTAGAQTIFASFSTPVLPASANDFRDDARAKVWRNGNLQSKGTGKDVQWVSQTQLSFKEIVKPNDEIVIESPASF